MNMGHLQLQLACSVELHNAHLISDLEQLVVLCLPAQFPHLSNVCVHSLVKWFYPWHFMHLVGSCLAFPVWHHLLHMFRPLVIALFAALAELNASIRCADVWFGDLLLVGFAHLMVDMVSGLILLNSHISVRWFSSPGSMASGMLNAMILNILALNLIFGPLLSHIFFWFLGFAIQAEALSVVISIVIPPLLVVVMDWILPKCMSNSESILLSSVLSCIVLKCEIFVSFIPSSKNCQAFIPSFAASFGLTCGGGLIRVDA